MSQSSTDTRPRRLLSLDALRGFDMFWITGGEEIFHLLAEATGWTGAIIMAEQLSHPDWNGFRAYDLIFPLFLFLSGVSAPYSLGIRLERGDDRGKMLRKVIQRGLTLVLLGIIYNNGLQIKPLAEMRFPSVLARIGLAGMFAQIIYLYTSTRTQYIWFVSLLLGYWAFVMLVPVPGCGAGHMTIECNPVSYLDRLIIPGHLHKDIHDPEGLISTVPAIATGLLGIFAGNLLRADERSTSRTQKVLFLFVAGIVFLIIGKLWDYVFPINKNLWTSSFVMIVGGWSLILLSIFYWIIDVQGWNRYAWILAVIGMNSILIYMAQHFIDFEHTSVRLFRGIVKYFSEPYQKVFYAIGYVIVEWLMLWFLYKKKVFLKV
ncbi:acyltransferase family protein [Runella sp.]|uniref:acyltransferase family protein n=1 Tax=Runella sp. TaxID=1960881 RepID=UPI003D0B995F